MKVAPSRVSYPQSPFADLANVYDAARDRHERVFHKRDDRVEVGRRATEADLSAVGAWSGGIAEGTVGCLPATRTERRGTSASRPRGSSTPATPTPSPILGLVAHLAHLALASDHSLGVLDLLLDARVAVLVRAVRREALVSDHCS